MLAEDLRRLATGAAAAGEARSVASMLSRGAVAVAVLGVFALACAFATIGFLGLAVYFAALAKYSPPEAAGLAALAAAVVMAVLGLAMWRVVQPESRPSPLAAAAQTPPKTVWDLVALVATGVLAGLSSSQKH